MNTKLLLTLAALLALAVVARAQGTALTYQGRLNNNGAPAHGSYDLQFTILDAPTGGSQIGSAQTASAVAVNNGLFTVTLDFGSGVFNGADRWLLLSVKTNGAASFTPLTPPQPITSTPYAITARNLSEALPSASLSGTYANAVTLNNAANSFSGNGSNLTTLNASQLGSGTVPAAALSNAWRIGGNFGATPGTHFLGTTDTNALEFKVNGQRALQIEYATDTSGLGYSPNIVGGFSGNIISNGFAGGLIAGGGASQYPNRVGGDFGSVLGGAGNVAIRGTAMGMATLAAGSASTAMGSGTKAIGQSSTAMGNATTASGLYSIAMGSQTTASTDNTTAMGFRAMAIHPGAFVWADQQFADFASTGVNQFCLRASGGVQLSGDTKVFFGSTLSQKLNLYGTTFGIGIQSGTQYHRVGAGASFAWYAGGVHNDNTLNAGGGTFLMHLDGNGNLFTAGAVTPSSDRNAKENFVPVQPREMLEKVVALPLSSWNYKADTATRHVGPMAQDFYAAFDVGPDDKHIATVDADGVALAAIQGLNRKVEEKAARIAELERRLEKLERLITEKNSGAP